MNENTNLMKRQVHEKLWRQLEFEILEKQVSKVEHLFSTCTQKVKYRKPRYETLEKDQRFWLKREERTLAIERKSGAKILGA